MTDGPSVFRTRKGAEAFLDMEIHWAYEHAKHNSGLSSYFNHAGRWIGFTTKHHLVTQALVYIESRDRVRGSQLADILRDEPEFPAEPPVQECLIWDSKTKDPTHGNDSGQGESL